MTKPHAAIHVHMEAMHQIHTKAIKDMMEYVQVNQVAIVNATRKSAAADGKPEIADKVDITALAFATSCFESAEENALLIKRVMHICGMTNQGWAYMYERWTNSVALVNEEEAAAASPTPKTDGAVDPALAPITE